MSSVRRRLRQHGIRAYRPFRGMTLTRQHRLRRLRWARQFHCWQNRNRQRVLFSDESRFQLFRADGRTRIYRPAGENSSVLCSGDCTVGGGSVMVWDGICGQQRTYPIVIDGNIAYLHMVDMHAIETCFLWSDLFTFVREVLYEITHFTHRAVVNCDIILWFLLSILVFIYRQIIILSKYNICINLYFVLLLIH